MNQWIFLPSRAVVAVEGPEAREFLQGLVTQDVLSSLPTFSALLTPQGRFHSDFFIVPCAQGVWLECDEQHKLALLDVLDQFKILHQVTVTDLSQHYGVCVAIGSDLSELESYCEQEDLVCYADPRNPSLGTRVIMGREKVHRNPSSFAPMSESHYHHHRIKQGIAEGAYDLISGKSIILEYGYHPAISWDKGCYVGQELMARTFHRGQVHKKIYRLYSLHDPFPPLGTPLTLDSEKIGLMGSHCGNWGLACLVIEKASPLTAGETLCLKWDGNKLLVSGGETHA